MNDVFRAHDPGPHPEQPARYDAVLRAIEAAGWVTEQAPAAPPEALARVHAPAHIARLERFSDAGGGAIDADTFVSARSLEAAVCGCGAAMAAVDAVLDGRAPFAFAAGRPPGHHAERGRSMGFCILNQTAVAAAHARARGIERVAVLDWDVHHGNGTQAIFWADPDVLYVSLHQFGWGFFPGTGAASERGGGAGEGATVNVALDAGTGEAGYLHAFRTVALPALEAHSPQLVIVSAGFDAHAADPLGSLQLSASAFPAMAEELAARGVPMALVLEGGYDLAALEASAAATLGALSPR